MPPCAAADPFAASRTAFDALTLELGAEGAARLGHGELEELLELRVGSCGVGSCCRTTSICVRSVRSGRSATGRRR